VNDQPQWNILAVIHKQCFIWVFKLLNAAFPIRVLVEPYLQKI